MFVGDAIARFRTGAHYKKYLGTRVRQEIEFGERFHMMEARENMYCQDGLAERVIECRAVGQHARTGAMIGPKPDGLTTGRHGRRLPESVR